MGRKLGEGAVPLGEELGPHVTQCCLGRGLPLYQWHLDPSRRLVTTDMGRRLGWLCPFSWGNLDPHLAQCGLSKGLPPPTTKWHHDSSSRLATIDMGQKLGVCAPFWPWGGGAGSPSNTIYCLGRGLPPYQLSGILIHPAIWPSYMDRKLGSVPLWGSGSWSSSNGPRPTCMPSFILIIQPFGHNTPMLQTERQTDRTGQTTA